jgi:hypothetical protein
MRCKVPDKAFFADLKDLNAEFVGLLQRYPGAEISGVMGLDCALWARVRALNPTEVEFLAATPHLLAGFSELPSVSSVSDHRERPLPGEGRWFEAARVFAASLMTCIRDSARHDRLRAALCLGPTVILSDKLAALSFRDIQSIAGLAAIRLRAQFAGNPRFWPDLLRASVSGDRELRSLACLAGIRLSLARRGPATHQGTVAGSRCSVSNVRAAGSGRLD